MLKNSEINVVENNYKKIESLMDGEIYASTIITPQIYNYIHTLPKSLQDKVFYKISNKKFETLANNYLTPFICDYCNNQVIEDLTKEEILSEQLICEKCKDELKTLKYNDFLKTPYWKGVANKVKEKAEHKCQLCNNEDKLVAHHRTYEHHGEEHIYLNDLICLCGDCHNKFHNIKNKKNKNGKNV